jgi:hypothetical protein
MDIYKSMALEMEIKNVLNSFFSNVYDSGTSYNFRCNVCGDSKKNKSKKRGYILKANDPWMYYCHNCQCSMSVEKWLKEFFPLNYKNYVSEMMKLKSGTKAETSLTKKFNNIKTKRKEKNSTFDEKKEMLNFKKLIEYPELIEYCKKRKIPEEIYLKWYYAETGMYNNRLIIPFYNDKGKIYYYQGRTMNDRVPKYLSRKGDYNEIYNYYNVDKEKPVIILEGPIDSIFVENSIGVTGIKVNNLDNFKHKYFLLDNDLSAKTKTLKLLKLGNYVFNWTLFLKKYNCTDKIKDVNDFILFNKDGIEKLTWDIIGGFFTNSIFDKIYFI